MSEKPPPLWMPEGSVRALLAFLIVIGSLAATAIDNPQANELRTMAGMVLTFYFVTRKAEGA